MEQGIEWFIPSCFIKVVCREAHVSYLVCTGSFSAALWFALGFGALSDDHGALKVHHSSLHFRLPSVFAASEALLCPALAVSALCSVATVMNPRCSQPQPAQNILALLLLLLLFCKRLTDYHLSCCRAGFWSDTELCPLCFSGGYPAVLLVVWITGWDVLRICTMAFRAAGSASRTSVVRLQRWVLLLTHFGISLWLQLNLAGLAVLSHSADAVRHCMFAVAMQAMDGGWQSNAAPSGT